MSVYLYGCPSLCRFVFLSLFYAQFVFVFLQQPWHHHSILHDSYLCLITYCLIYCLILHDMYFLLTVFLNLKCFWLGLLFFFMIFLYIILVVNFRIARWMAKAYGYMAKKKTHYHEQAIIIHFHSKKYSKNI